MFVQDNYEYLVFDELLLASMYGLPVSSTLFKDRLIHSVLAVQKFIDICNDLLMFNVEVFSAAFDLSFWISIKLCSISSCDEMHSYNGSYKTSVK